MRAVHGVLRDAAMLHAVMETVQDEMVWTPEMGVWTLSSRIRQSSALRLAAGGGQAGCVEELLSRGAEVNFDPGGSTPLHDACSGGHDGCVRLLLQHGADHELQDSHGSTALHRCNTAQSLRCAELLLEAGAQVNVRARGSGLTPLHVAARRGLQRHVELLLLHGADVAAVSEEGETPLNAACAAAERPSDAAVFVGIARTLLRSGADPRTAGRKKHTPLHNACANCCASMAELLLQHGADATATNCAGNTPLDCLLQVVEDFQDHQPEAVARSLLNHGAKPALPQMLRQCVSSAATLELLLNSYPSVPPCDWMDSLPPHLYELPVLSVLRCLCARPRSLQHLCRCELRRLLGGRGPLAVGALRAPPSVKEYLLLLQGGLT